MKVVIIVAALVGAALPVVAQAAPLYNGIRIEGHAGGDRVAQKLDYADGIFDFSAKDHFTGVVYGATVGYDLQSQSGFLLGTEATIDLSSAKQCATDAGARDCTKMGREFAIGVRVGQQIGEHGPLLYGKVAWVRGRIRSTSSDGIDSVSTHDDRSGWQLGAGIEQAVNQRVYVKAEYRYTNYKDYTFSGDGANAALSFDRNQVIGGVGVHF